MSTASSDEVKSSSFTTAITPSLSLSSIFFSLNASACPFIITETTMADPTTMQRRVPVGYRFCPTEEELVAYYLRHKLMAHDPSIHNTIPEIDVCKYEPWELLAPAASAFPETDQDDSECYFFGRCDYKYSNSTRFKRTTSLGFWKVTGKDKPIKDFDTNKVIGLRKI